MKLNIDFDELCDAFEQSSLMRHYFIDAKENRIIYINEEIEMNASEELEKMENDKYIKIPERMPEDDFSIAEFFAYELDGENFKLAEKFHEILEGYKPFRNFKALLAEYPEIKEKWFQFKDAHIKNEAINWLCDNRIELEGQQLIKPIEISELTDLEKLPDDIRDFVPAACLNCNNKEGLKARFFLINAMTENALIEKEAKRIMKEKYGIEQYGFYTGGEKELLTASKCPKCGSEDIIWDY